MIAPGDEAEAIAAIGDAVAQSRRLAIVSGESKADVGAPAAASILSLARIQGVVDYDPPELVLTVRPGTRLVDLEALLRAERQMLAFEPFDHGPIFGRKAGAATIGGIVAAGISGSRRVSAGAARDHLLGLRAVSGRAETFIAGAKVVKNVTGYDVPKLAAGSWGRLFAMTELTLKVLPAPETEASVGIQGLGPGAAIRVMAAAMGSQAEVAAAAHRPAAGSQDALTVLRVEGFAPSVAARTRLLRECLAPHGEADVMDDEAARPFWSDLRTLGPLAGDEPLWRINIPPGAAPELVATLGTPAARWLMDWAGGLVWLASSAGPSVVRDAARAAGGHAMLLRAPTPLRGRVPAFHPQPAGVAALEARVRRAFDPAGLFETGRF